MMSYTHRFEYQRFIKLSDSALVEYMQPIIYDSKVKVLEYDLQQMLMDLNEYDEYHLVFALEIGSFRSPETFAPYIPRYLCHEYASVRCAADRILRGLPSNCITSDLIDSIESILPSIAEAKYMASTIFDDLVKRFKSTKEHLGQ